MSNDARITVGIATKNRPDSLVRCLRSLAIIDLLVEEVIVIDDGSSPPLEPLVRAQLSEAEQRRLAFVRFAPSVGPAAARNEVVRRARAPWTLNIDDDVVMLSELAIRNAVRTIAADVLVFAVAFTQADATGTAWPLQAQPGPVTYDCYVPSFIGFAHLVRNDAFRALGGFREALLINGEERELCLRVLDAGWHVVYLPSARIAHLPDPGGRDMRRYLYQTVRNGCLASIYDDPFLLMCVRVPMRLRAYFRMRNGWKVDDPGGFWVILRELHRSLPSAWRVRRAVRWSTIRRWRLLVRSPQPYRRSE